MNYIAMRLDGKCMVIILAFRVRKLKILVSFAKIFDWLFDFIWYILTHSHQMQKWVEQKGENENTGFPISPIKLQRIASSVFLVHSIGSEKNFFPCWKSLCSARAVFKQG